MNNYYKPRGFGGGFLSFPPIIKNLLIINVVVFLLSNSILEARVFLMKWLALNPINLEGYSEWPFNFQIWQLITYQFMHGGFWHLFFNMFMLWMFGASIEEIFGSKKFLVFYLLAGVSAGLLQLFLSPLLGGAYAPTIGASGAVFGVMLAYAIFFPDNLIFIYFLIPVKAKYFIGFLVIIELFAVNDIMSDVAHLAHLGGALFAFLFIMFDKNSYVSLKNVFRRSYFYKSSSSNDFFKNPFSNSSKSKADIEEAEYQDINQKVDTDVTQAEIDKILDKISQSGYQNLTDREKHILFQASKKMK